MSGLQHVHFVGQGRSGRDNILSTFEGILRQMPWFGASQTLNVAWLDTFGGLSTQRCSSLWGV